VTLFTDVAANSLGIARGAIDAFIELAASESTTGSPVVLRERPLVQARLAEAEAILNAARAYVVDSVGTLWKAVCGDASDPSLAIAQARACHCPRHARGGALGRSGVPCGGNKRDLQTQSVGAILSGHPCRRSAQRRIPCALRIRRQVLMGLRPADVGW
jgi:indole-3-acetate monooxygenase